MITTIPVFKTMLQSLTMVGILAASTASLPAAQITATAVIDLSTAITGNQWTGYGHALVAPVQVRSGDSVTLKVDFAGGQTLTWHGDGELNPWLMLGSWPGPYDSSQDGFFKWSNTVVTFADLSRGTPIDSASIADGSAGAIHLGPTLVIEGGNIVRTFSGFSVSFMTEFTDNDPFREYGTLGYLPNLYPVFSGTVDFNRGPSAPAVPDQGAMWGLLGLPFVALVAARRAIRG